MHDSDPELAKTILLYFDDCLLAAETFDELIAKLELFLATIEKIGLKVQPRKCLFCKQLDTETFGFTLSTSRVEDKLFDKWVCVEEILFLLIEEIFSKPIYTISVTKIMGFFFSMESVRLDLSALKTHFWEKAPISLHQIYKFFYEAFLDCLE